MHAMSVSAKSANPNNFLIIYFNLNTKTAEKTICKAAMPFLPFYFYEILITDYISKPNR